jgi:hypothetical protein
MIPTMKKDKGRIASMLIGSISKDGSGHEVESEANESGYGLEECMNKFIVSFQAGDAKKAAEAFKEAFTICESEPHEEYSEE